MVVLPLLSKAEQKKKIPATRAAENTSAEAETNSQPSARPPIDLQRPPEPDYDNEARYRALRRVAIVAHDHEREMDFFAGEILARRDKMGGWKSAFKDPMMTLSYPYQWFSDFGRSMPRPILWWCFTLGFVGPFLYKIIAALDWPPEETPYRGFIGPFLFMCKVIAAFWENEKPSTCMQTGPFPFDEAYWSALLLSFKRMLFSFDRSDTTKKIYDCLYGSTIPNAAIYAEILQSTGSALLIFLFILSVRNHFRIR